MRSEASSEGEAEAEPTWAPVQEHAANPDWHTVDRALRAIAQRRAALDAEEAGWLRHAEALQIWRPLGMVSALDYLERVLGYAPRTAQDRLRVARALGSLPQLTAALTRGELAFSAVRELTRVATPATEASWTAAALGKNLRQIEELVADHRPGDRPDDPPDPEARTHVVRFELSAETFALLRQARTILDDEHGKNLPDDAFIAALCGTVLDGAPTTEPTGRAKFQIAVTVCERCQQGWQHGAGAKLAIRPAAVERALCDAQHLGSLDGDAPERAHQDIPPSVVRFVWRRDGGRCQLPGCRSARGLELHHVVHRADGGSHDASNLVLACSACHQAHHAGALTISGTADHLEVRRRAELPASAPATPRSTAPTNAHVGAATEPSRVATTGAHVGAGTEPSRVTTNNAHVGAATEPSRVTTNNTHVGAVRKLDAAVLRAQTKDALVGLGWKSAIACAAVAAAATSMGPEMTLERFIFEALRQCPGGKRDGRTSPRAP
jgi:HNH endonuclease